MGLRVLALPGPLERLGLEVARGLHGICPKTPEGDLPGLDAVAGHGTIGHPFSGLGRSAYHPGPPCLVQPVRYEVPPVVPSHPRQAAARRRRRGQADPPPWMRRLAAGSGTAFSQIRRHARPQLVRRRGDEDDPSPEGVGRPHLSAAIEQFDRRGQLLGPLGSPRRIGAATGQTDLEVGCASPHRAEKAGRHALVRREDVPLEARPHELPVYPTRNALQQLAGSAGCPPRGPRA